jgi:superfamily II DNA or RNA helicase
MNRCTIQTESRVLCPDHPEYGFGVVKLIDDNILDDQRTCQVAFDWIAGLTPVSEAALRQALQFVSGSSIPATEWGGLEDLQRRLGSALSIAENSRTGNFIRSFVSPLPHQLFLLEKIVSHNRLGHVIADDVGMGKTIEAGLIIASMRQQDPRSRILVLSPAGVVLQWQDEMEEHFGLDFSIVGRDFNPKSLPNWKNHALILASLDTLKQEQHQEILKQIPPFDLIICDEAHRLTAKREFLSNELYRTRNYRFIEWMSTEHVVQWTQRGDGAPRSPRLLLLSGTPHQGDDLRFAYLLQLVRPDQINAEAANESGDLLTDPLILEECITRTAKKRAVDWSGKSIFMGHETQTRDVDLEDDEKEVLAALSRYVLREMQFTNGGTPLIRALAMHTFQKIAASSWAALETAMRNRLSGNSGVREDFSDEGSMGSEFEPDLDEKEQQAIQGLLGRIERLTGNSKWNRFAESIKPGNGFRESGDRLLIFTQYRRTQEWLEERLTDQGERVAIIHGGLSLDERKRQRAYFESEGTVLLSTEAGSEGANLHRKCHLEINYDLPWNPMRLLQRIGRLDRYGQKHKVRVINLRAPQSWDSEISARIALRLESVQASMGQVADEDYEAMILGEVHEAINVPEIMRKSNWGEDSSAVDAAVDEAVQKILSRKSALDQLFRESMGMPEDFGKSAPTLQSDDFRQAFAWAAAGQNVQLKETRTSDNRYLKDVYHFTLPGAFHGGFRPSREVHLVFDRDTFAEVRGEVLGIAKGQEIKPSLAGFGDPVTDWFFRTGLQAGDGRSLFALERLSNISSQEKWWVSYAARWKQPGNWSGPDALFTFALDSDGNVLRLLPTKEVFAALHSSKEARPSTEPLPELAGAQAAAKIELRSSLPKGIDTRHLALFHLSLIWWAE